MLGSLDRTPPPLFRQGYSALTRLIFFAALSVFLMVADTRMAMIQPLRTTIATALNPAQRALLVPVGWVTDSTDYARKLHDAVESERRAREALVEQSQRAAAADVLARENVRLRALLDLKPKLAVRTMAADVLYEARDPYSRKVYIDRGSTQGVKLGSPVMTEQGVIGQVTRAYPLSAEVTLLIDKNAAIPVINGRTQQRLAAYGGAGADAPMELRFVSSAADVQVGDRLQTSGLDGVYPPGLSVALVTEVTRNAAGGFARIVLTPDASMDRLDHVLVLEPTAALMPERPLPDTDAAARPGRKKKAGDKPEAVAYGPPAPTAADVPAKAEGPAPSPADGAMVGPSPSSAAQQPAPAVGSNAPGPNASAPAAKPAPSMAPKPGTASPATQPPAQRPAPR
jgi:rod shape-determining protein MreC